MQRQHVLFVTGEYPPMAGGVGAYTATLARYLTKLGTRVSVLTSVDAQDAVQTAEDTCKRSPNAAALEGIHVYPLMHRWGPGIVASIAGWAERLQCEWIHVQYQTSAFDLRPYINLAPWWWQRTVRVGWTYHDLLGPKLFPKAGNRLRTWVVNRPASICDVTIVTNEGDRGQLGDLARRVEKIPIGSNIEPVPVPSQERSRRRRVRHYTEQDVVIGYFGFLNRSKGGLTLVRTLHSLRERHVPAQLLMIGDPLGASDPTNEAYLAEVRELAEQLGVAHAMQWTGHLPDAQISAEFAVCDMLLMPYEDGASLRRGTLMAGLAHGCAIVTTVPVDPLPELEDGRDILFIPPHNAKAAADAVLQIAHHPVLAEKLRQNAASRSRLFAWEHIARQHQAVYSEIGR